MVFLDYKVMARLGVVKKRAVVILLPFPRNDYASVSTTLSQAEGG